MDIFAKVRELDLPAGKYAVFGSGPLQAHGLRESNDIDVIVSPEIYEQLEADPEWKEKTWPSGDICLEKDIFEVTSEWTARNDEQVYQPDIQRLINEAEIIDGIPFVRLEEVLTWKKVRGKEKDLKDIELIENYLVLANS